MSHTDKDRPFWVKRNDATLLRYTDHNHLLLNKQLTKRVYLTDDEGQRYLETRVYKHVGFDYFKAERAGYFDRNLTASERAEFKRVFHADLYSEQELERTDWAYEIVPDGRSPVHCTEGEPVTREHRWYYDSRLPCAPELTLEHGYGSGRKLRPGVQKQNRRLLRGSERTHKRTVLTAYVKEVNTYGSAKLDELNDDRAPVAQRPKYWLDWD